METFNVVKVSILFFLLSYNLLEADRFSLHAIRMLLIPLTINSN